MNTLLTDYLPRLDLREPQAFKNIVIIPVFGRGDDHGDYLTLTEALAQHLATIIEVSASAHIPNVKVINSSDLCLLLIDGEELIGARQNRSLNASILLPERSETVVPVTCTEAGRWFYKSAAFADAGYVSPHKMRKVKSSSVSAALRRQMGYKSDQHAVWGEVAHYCLALHAQSPTSAMQDAVAAKAKELEEVVCNLKPLPNQNGLVVLVNGEIAGADVVSSARAYRVLHPKFVRSYALEALMQATAVIAEKASEKAASFFEASKASTEHTHQTVGRGEYRRFEGQTLGGSALVADGKVVHLNLYRN